MQESGFSFAYYSQIEEITAWKVSVLETFWSIFPHISTEYGGILRISPYSVQTRKNTDQKNSEYGHISRSEYDKFCYIISAVCTNGCLTILN